MVYCKCKRIYFARGNEDMYEVQSVVNYYLSKEAMTHKKLQKILYYAYSWFLVLENEDLNEETERLFDEKFQAWVHGPVVPEVYKIYKTYRSDMIPQVESDSFSQTEFTPDTIDILEQVWDIYGRFNGNQLESISHQELPWIEGRGDCSPIEICRTVIKDETIFNTYGARLND